MNKKVYIVHGWGSNSKSKKFIWLKNELEKKNFEVVLLDMPDTLRPKIEAWVGKLKEVVGLPDENIFFVGHSIGCQTIMRYLQTLPVDMKVGGAVFIAGWFKIEGLEKEGEEAIAVGRPWIETPIDFEKVRSVCQKISVFLSDNEPYGYIEENKKIFEDKLGAKVIMEHNKGHFTEDDGIIDLPYVLEELLRISDIN